MLHRDYRIDNQVGEPQNSIDTNMNDGDVLHNTIEEENRVSSRLNYEIGDLVEVRALRDGRVQLLIS